MSDFLITKASVDYELLDSGGGEKLERYGNVVISRPDPQALWPKLKEEKWAKSDAVFNRVGKTGKWQVIDRMSKRHFDIKDWRVTLEGLTFSLSLLPSKHIGVFPEQSVHWRWLKEKIQTRHKLRISTNDTNKIKVLNLFGYTGGATLACAKAGAEVVHVDSSEFAVDLAHKNLELSQLSNKPVRFIVDDAPKFVEREIKRGNKYDIIVLDPPVYGKGIKKETWKIEEDLLPLLSRLKNILSGNPLAILLNGYASGYSHITYSQILKSALHDIPGSVTSGELAIKESSGRLLPSGIYARFEC